LLYILEYLIVRLVRFVLLLLLFNFVMHCIISTVVVAFEINYLSNIQTMRFHYPVKIWYRSDIRYFPPEILQFYNFDSLAGKCLTTPSFCFLGVLNPLILWVVIQTPKGTSLGDDASFKP